MQAAEKNIFLLLIILQTLRCQYMAKKLKTVVEIPAFSSVSLLFWTHFVSRGCTDFRFD